MTARNSKVKAKKRYSGFDKIIKTNALLDSSYLRDYIPPTTIMTKSSLLKMLNQHGMVYVKPKNGSLGRGVIRVTKIGERYSVHIKHNVKQYKFYNSVYRKIISSIRKEKYIVQKGIYSLRKFGRIFDFRVVVQLNPNNEYEVTGIVGRLSKAGRVVSNGGGGGAVGTVDSLLTAAQAQMVIPQLEKLSLAAMEQVAKKYPEQNEIGLDFVVDHQLKPWIVEYNTRPNHSMFAILPDKSIIKRIVAYGENYGRKYRL